MKGFLSVLLISILIISVFFLATNPELLDKVWLYLIGFFGGIVGLFRNLFDQLKPQANVVSIVDETPTKDSTTLSSVTSTPEPNEMNKLISKVEKLEQNVSTVLDTFEGTTINVLRYTDDGETTLGLMFIRNTFFSYTLEDTYRDDKVANETRIPAGTYAVDFLKSDTKLTKKYRNKFSWFNYHLEIKDIENYTGVYIHIGNNHKHTAGCLLIADGINASSTEKKIYESTKAFERFYKRMSDLINSGEKIRIVIQDEDWLKDMNQNKN